MSKYKCYYYCKVMIWLLVIEKRQKNEYVKALYPPANLTSLTAKYYNSPDPSTKP